jgi:hypothetical protein
MISDNVSTLMAVVEQLVLGRDGLVRSAKTRTDIGVTNRPIVKPFPWKLQNFNYEIIFMKSDTSKDCILKLYNENNQNIFTK